VRTVGGGVGVFVLSQALPRELELAGGNNLQLVWKGFGKKSVVHTFAVRCPKRGEFALPCVQWQALHLFGFLQTLHGSIANTEVQLLVKFRTPHVRRIRAIKGSAISPSVLMDTARIGVATTDFKDIRRYVLGDPMRTINWKATARGGFDPQAPPLVNDYEREGKKAVWVFLDADASMEFGDTIHNCFEYALEAAQCVTYYFAMQGYNIGMYVYNGDQKLFYPDSGSRQLFRLSSEFLRLKTARRGETLRQAVEKCRGFIIRHSPMCIVITRVDGEASNTLAEGVLALDALHRRRGKQMPVMVIGVSGYTAHPDENDYDRNTRRIQFLDSRLTISALRSAGAFVVEWDPGREDIFAALMRRKRAR
jgi:uncharacterized protein (DUF58 family)